MSEFVTHMAVFEDCTRLAILSPRICAPFKTVLTKYKDLASLGTLTRSGDTYVVQLLDYCREHWANRRDGDFLEEKLAFVLGWRCHNAAHRHFKPIYREVQPEHYKSESAGQDPDERDVSDVRIYHDIILYREVYDNGRRSGISPYLMQDYLSGHPAARSVAVAATESALGGVVQRTLLGLQPFASKATGIDAWLDRFHKRLQDYYVDIHRYSHAFEEPQADFLRRFILENRVYNRTDSLIRLARALHLEKDHADISLDTAVEQAQNQSQYAQTIRQGYLYLLASSEFFERKIGEPELRRRMDLGSPHYQPLSGAKQ